RSGRLRVRIPTYSFFSSKIVSKDMILSFRIFYKISDPPLPSHQRPKKVGLHRIPMIAAGYIVGQTFDVPPAWMVEVVIIIAMHSRG
ncbi:MAG: hypothetical protein OEW45_12170, partial [Deltaproteobacteria bacterium]|nr:hypothetical protein [Deltaproteobacteria bacterium]